MNPALRTTWAPRGHTPRIVASASHRKTSMAGWCCYRTGHTTRLMFGPRPDGHFTAANFPGLLRRLHRFLNTKVVLIWDNLTGHVRDRGVLAFLHDNADWLTVYRLPGYAPELNPVEGLWGELKNGPLANLTARTLDEVTTTARHALRLAQYQPALLNSFLAETGLTMG
ncbi:transposase [Streptomyces sp. NPDC005065]|uniref:transposase n=1 Tax=unclassified Streptomyces TaxID=2593676 RepID=UPI0033B55ED8